MYRYVGDISALYHNIIENYCTEFYTAIDCTLGNGFDTDFLSEKFHKVFAFDIQESAINQYKTKNKGNVSLICDSHANLTEYVEEKVDCIVFNLGFLPGGNKEITTKAGSTIESIRQSLTLMKEGAIMTIAIYSGHEEGMKEKEAVLNLVAGLPKDDYGVMLHSFFNRNKNAPMLLVIEKNLK